MQPREAEASYSSMLMEQQRMEMDAWMGQILIPYRPGILMAF